VENLMNKTIEIKVKTPLSKDQLDSFIEGNVNGICIYNQLYGDDTKQFFNAKLIIEVPEKVATITERQFDEIVKNHDGTRGLDALAKVKKILFK
jgi:hypothetical protein